MAHRLTPTNEFAPLVGANTVVHVAQSSLARHARPPTRQSCASPYLPDDLASILSRRRPSFLPLPEPGAPCACSAPRTGPKLDRLRAIPHTPKG